MPDAGVIAVFLLVYLGMFLGELPGLRLDRTGVALLGAVALLATGSLSLDAAAAAIDVPTVAILFAFMVISAQLRLAGFFGWAAEYVLYGACIVLPIWLIVFLLDRAKGKRSGS